MQGKVMLTASMWQSENAGDFHASARFDCP